MKKINKTSEVYEFVQNLITRSAQNGYGQLAEELDVAMHIGSSGLEILGAIRRVLLSQSDEISLILEKDEIETVKRIVSFVDQVYGR